MASVCIIEILKDGATESYKKAIKKRIEWG
jgi:hypothetical protein